MKSIKVGNSRYIRDLNLAGIFRLIYNYGPVSRKELSENTGYSAATISNHVKKLIKEGFVIETRKGSSTGGRKPVYLTVNPDKGYILTVNIDVRMVNVTIFNLQLHAEFENVFPISEGDSPDDINRRILEKIEQILHKQGKTTADILGIGMAVPGLINRDKQILEFAPNLGWRDIKILEPLKNQFDCPIILENEAKAAAIGEKEFIHPGVKNMVFVSLKEGIGCGLIIDGELYRGTGGNAGEFGHIIIDSDGPQCHCGNFGCWETLASEIFIINSYQHKTGARLTKDEIFQRGMEGDPEVLAIFKEAGRNIGIGLVNILNSLSPEMLVIGGDISRIRDYILPEIKEVLKEKALSTSYENTVLEFSQLGNSATLYGLAKLVFDRCIQFG